MNKKDNVCPKIKARKALAKENRTRQNSRFLKKSDKKVPQNVANPATSNHNMFMHIKIIKRRNVLVSSDTHSIKSNNVVNFQMKNDSIWKVPSSVFISTLDGTLFKTKLAQ